MMKLLIYFNNGPSCNDEYNRLKVIMSFKILVNISCKFTPKGAMNPRVSAKKKKIISHNLICLVIQ